MAFDFSDLWRSAMHYTTSTLHPNQEESDCLVVAVFKDQKLSLAAEQINAASNGSLKNFLATGDLSEEVGKTLLLYNLPNIKAPRVLCVYSGTETNCSEIDFRNLYTQTIATLKSLKVTRATSYLTHLSTEKQTAYQKIRFAIEWVESALYTFDHFKEKKQTTPNLQELAFNIEPTHEKDAIAAIKDGLAITLGKTLAQDLANKPANLCTPSDVVKAAQILVESYNLRLEVLEKSDMEKLGMGGLLAVSQGSCEPPKFVVLHYQGAQEKPIVLIGKGVTFDSGGISIKPANAMEEMKFDMTGAASVLGTIRAVAERQLPIHVIGLLPLAENLPSGTAVKPGDVITTLSKQTVEVINTDAEGRLILADALSYSEKFNPELVIDIATLTGAVVVALGHVASGLMSNDQELSDELITAGNQSGDRIWQLPLWEDYQSQIDSNVADISNVGERGGQSITAACFLSRFAKKFRWAHLDIAGTGWNSGKQKAATGRPVPLLVQFLLNRCKVA
jgi:leucyl aminopeptidase